MRYFIFEHRKSSEWAIYEDLCTQVIRELGDKGDRSGQPTEEMRILDCGILREGEAPPVDLSFTAALAPPMTELDFQRVRAGNRVRDGLLLVWL